MLWNLKIKEIKSFNPNPYDLNYELIDLVTNYPKVIKKFKEDILSLESLDSDSILCFRGDSKKNVSKHNQFFEKELGKIFMIGSKSRSNYVKNEGNPFDYYKGKESKDLLRDIQNLIDDCNLEIASKPDSHPVNGKIDKEIIEYLSTKNIKELEHWRLFFISFLHNNGKGKKIKSFKDYSPFISLTYGKNKGRIARKFATHKIGHGLVYIVSVNKGDRSYIRTRDMNLDLKRFGVDWYEDIHNELMLINGVFPHDILGVMEVRKKSTPILIINPWLFKEYLEGKKFNPIDGIPINQENFKEFVKSETDYKRYSWKDRVENHYSEEISQEGYKDSLTSFQ